MELGTKETELGASRNSSKETSILSTASAMVLSFFAWPNAHMLHSVSFATGTSALAAVLVPLLEKGENEDGGVEK